MMKIISKQNIFLVLFFILVAFLDLSSKWYVKNHFNDIFSESNAIRDSENFFSLNSFLDIRNLCNNGVSFGILSGIESKYMTIIISFIFIILLIYSYFFLKSEEINPYFIVMIIGGAIANLIDRIQNSCVYDFIDFHINQYHFYVFNIADSFITVGTVLILVSFKKWNKIS